MPRLHLIDKPEAKSKALLKWARVRILFPTGGIIVDSREHRGSLYDRSRLVPHPRPGGTRKRCARHLGHRSLPKFPGWCRNPGWSEKIAELLNDKKLPLIGDVRDESARTSASHRAEIRRGRSRIC